MPSSVTIPLAKSLPQRDERVVELGRLLASGRSSRRDVALAASKLPGFANLLVDRVGALERGPNWHPDPDCAVARLGFRRTAAVLREYLASGDRL